MKIKERGRAMREVDFGKEEREGRKKSQYKRRSKKRGIRMRRYQRNREREKRRKKNRGERRSTGI